MGYPTGYASQSGLLFAGPRVCVTMFESSLIPSDWVAPLNNMHAVIVPSHFCANTFRACGVTAPIHVVPLGVGDTYTFAERSTDRPLTFLAFLDRGERKGGLVATKAFGRAFGENMNVRLLLKARTRKNKDVTVTVVEPNIEILDRDMTEQELHELYLSCDVLVNPHKGEGFGLIPREFAATGGIAMTTGWSGTADDLKQWGWELPYTLEPATWPGHKRFAGQDLGEWAAPDVDGVAKCLVRVARNVDTYRLMARQHAANAKHLYTWDGFAKQVLTIWEGVAVGDFTRTAAFAA